MSSMSVSISGLMTLTAANLRRHAVMSKVLRRFEGHTGAILSVSAYIGLKRMRVMLAAGPRAEQRLPM